MWIWWTIRAGRLWWQHPQRDIWPLPGSYWIMVTTCVLMMTIDKAKKGHNSSSNSLNIILKLHLLHHIWVISYSRLSAVYILMWTLLEMDFSTSIYGKTYTLGSALEKRLGYSYHFSYQKRSQQRWFRFLIMMPHGRSPFGFFFFFFLAVHPIGRRPRPHWRDYASPLALEDIPPGGAGKHCGVLLEREMSGILCWACCHQDLISDKGKKKKWMGWTSS